MGGGSEEIDEETLKMRAERQMEARFNKQKIFIKGGEVCIDKAASDKHPSN